MRTIHTVVALTLVAVSIGCASAPPPAAAPAPAAATVQDQSAAQAGEDSIARARAAQRLAAERRADSLAALQRRADEARATLTTMVHFDFNRADIRAEDTAILDQKIPILRANSAARIIVAGNCDERGSDEYNLALGNRRAMAARQYLLDRGIDASRIETTTYGEERPVDTAHTEASWARNRNDQFVLVNASVVFDR